MTADPDRELARLYWQSRRGMRELDLLLQGFLDRAGPGLTVPEREMLMRLLEYPDALLYEYLIGRSAPSDRELVGVIRRIRDAAAD